MECLIITAKQFQIDIDNTAICTSRIYRPDDIHAQESEWSLDWASALGSARRDRRSATKQGAS